MQKLDQDTSQGEVDKTNNNEASIQSTKKQKAMRHVRIYKLKAKKFGFGLKLSKCMIENVWKVIEIQENSPSSKKLQVGDHITCINGITVSGETDANEMTEMISCDKASVKIYRP